MQGYFKAYRAVLFIHLNLSKSFFIFLRRSLPNFKHFFVSCDKTKIVKILIFVNMPRDTLQIIIFFEFKGLDLIVLIFNNHLQPRKDLSDSKCGFEFVECLKPTNMKLINLYCLFIAFILYRFFNCDFLLENLNLDDLRVVVLIKNNSVCKLKNLKIGSTNLIILQLSISNLPS